MKSKLLYACLGLLILALSVTIFLLWKNYKGEEQLRNLSVGEQQNDLSNLISAQDEQINQLRKAIEEQQKQSTFVSQPTSGGKSLSASDVIEQWRKRVVQISCVWRYSDTGKIYEAGSGSGIIWPNILIGTGNVFTNRHVILNEQGYLADTCQIAVPNDRVYTINKTDIFKRDNAEDYRMMTVSNDNKDLGELSFLNPSQFYSSLDDGPSEICKEAPLIGEKVVILGYPSIGSQSGVTATEGIISGFDGDYFITSAKIDAGNSGGAAILVDKSCFLGIPTYARLGQVESLGRILNACSVLPLSIWCQPGEERG
ncbi:MAG: serine protease [bacterium]|nr:serine protease [bacterium]